jgi:hypothetical protein
MRQILVTAMTIGLMVLSASAQATIGHMQMQIPFAFHVNEVTLLPGTYDVDTISPALVRFANATTKQSVIAITPLSENGGYVSKPTLTFNRYGSDYFLSKMWFGQGSSGRALLPTPVERELAKNSRPAQIESVSARP